MMRVFLSGLMLAALVTLAGCSTPSDYQRTCVMGKDTVRSDCDIPGQSDESKGYQPQ